MKRSEGDSRRGGGRDGCSEILGAILAGGMSRRFGSDKAVARLGGRRLIDRAADAVAGHVSRVVVCGRAGGLADRPAPGLGPLGGLAAALHFGREAGFVAALTVPCDAPFLPAQAIARLCASPGAAYLEALPVAGLWPCALADLLDEHIAGGDRSMRGWAARIGAIPVAVDRPLANINTPADLRRLEHG